MPPYAIMVGTPARVPRLRFPEATVERLLASQRWRYSLYDLFDAPFGDIDRALDVAEDRIASGAVKPFAGLVMQGQDLADPLRFLDAAPNREAS